MENSTEMPNAAPAMGAMDRIINLFTSPAELYRYLIGKPDWFMPVMITIIFTITGGVVLKDVIQAEQAKATRQSIMNNSNIPDSQKEQTAEQSVEMMKKFWVVGFGVILLTAVGAYFVVSLFLWLGGKYFLKSEVSFMQVLSIYSYSTLIDNLGWLVKTPMIYMNQSMRVDTGLGMFLGEDAMHTWQYTLMSSFDLFALWKLAVLIIGIALLTKAPKGKTAVMVIAMWLVVVLIAVGFAMMGGVKVKG